MLGNDTFIVVRTAGAITSFNTKYYAIVGLNVVTKDETCKVVATIG